MAVPLSPRAGASPHADLDALRTRIDAVDDAVLDLLIRRAELSGEIATAKRRAGGTAAPVFRPGREAAILRRLIARTRAPLPAALVVQLWRQIFVASTRLQGRFAIAVSRQPASIGELACAHFGPDCLMSTASARAVVAAVVAGRASLGVVPPEEAWWQRPGPLCVLGRLPVIAAPGVRTSALVIGRQPFDPSGDDRHCVTVETEARSGAALRRALAKSGLEAPNVVASVRRRGSRWLHLVATDTPARELAANPAVRLVGGYARPFALPAAETKVK